MLYPADLEDRVVPGEVELLQIHFLGFSLGFVDFCKVKEHGSAHVLVHLDGEKK